MSNYYLEAVIEEEEGDILTAVTWLVTQGNGFNPVYQATMGGQQISLQREMERGGQTKRVRKTECLCCGAIHMCETDLCTDTHAKL